MSAGLRIGQGFDVHAFEDGDHVVLGGVTLPFERGLRAHSDGDVVLHALCDALLGALADGDIGQHFPDTDPTWAEADSRDLLRAVGKRVTAAGYHLVNADITVMAEAPKIGPHARAMREHIAADLGATVEQIAIKATTTEQLGFVGRREGIAAMAVILLERLA